MNDADVKADKDAIKDAGALATQKDLEAVNRDAETAKETAEAAEREAADAHSKATGAYLEAQEAQEKNTEQDKTLSEQGQKISENSTAIEQNTADIETNKQGIATNKENIEKNTQAITTERTERIQEVQRLDGRIDGLATASTSWMDALIKSELWQSLWPACIRWNMTRMPRLNSRWRQVLTAVKALLRQVCSTTLIKTYF